MPTYVLLSTLTPEGRQTLHKDPAVLRRWIRRSPTLVAKLSRSLRPWDNATSSPCSRLQTMRRLLTYRLIWGRAEP